MRSGVGSFHDREACARQAFYRIGFAFVEMNLSIRFVPSGLPNGDRCGEVELM